MPNKNGVVSIGLKVDYKDSLDKMLNDFRSTLQQVSNDAKKIKWDSNMAASFKAIQDRIDGVETDFKSMFNELNDQKLSTDNFKKYQEEISSHLGRIEADIKGLTGQFENLGNNDYVSKMIGQFEFLQKSIKDTQTDLGKIVDFTSSSNVINLDIVKQVGEYKKAIKDIQALRENAELPSIDLSDIDKAKKAYKDLYDEFVMLESREFDLQDEFDASSEEKRVAIERELYSVRQKMVNTLESLQELYDKIGSKNLGEFEDPNKIVAFDSKDIDKYIENATKFIQQNEKMVESYKETQSNLDALVTEFKVKNGAIHVPIEIDKISTTHKNQLINALNKLQEELDKKSVIAKVKLTLDDGTSKGRKKNADFDQQQIDGQKKPAAELSPAIQKMYREGAKSAEEAVKAGMVAIQKAFKDVPVTLKPDTDSFKKDLKSMIDDSFKAIAEDTTGLNINSELEKLVANLKEASTALSGNENFRIGLDEDSIKRISDAIENMANMIQRAFKVASDSDIAAQWSVIKDKFSSVADESGHIDARFNSNKAVMRELVVEYQKYLDMGGTKQLSALTEDAKTVNKLTQYYEELGKAVQETTQKQSAEKKSDEVSEDIKMASAANEALETQASKTSTALDDEGKVAQSAAERFRELAKEKQAATEANLELAIAAEMTTDALKAESEAQKEVEKSSKKTKPNKNAISADVYADNYLQWQRNIKQSLLDEGDYEEVYNAKINQGSNGVVKFTAYVKTMGDEINGVEGEWKKLIATVNDSGDILSPSLNDVRKNELATIKKAEEAWRKYSEAMESGGSDPTSYNREQLEEYISTIINAEGELDKFRIKKVSLNNTGGLDIATEFVEANGQIKSFVAHFDSVEDVIDHTKGSVNDLSELLQKAFDSGKFTTTIPKNAGTSYDSLGKLFDTSKTFSDINEVRDNLKSLFGEIGKVRSKSIQITGLNTLTAQIVDVNGEIRNMSVNLDGNGFARYVDDGIREFSRLETAITGVFKGIGNLVRIYLSPQDFIRYFRQGFDVVKDVNTAMTELRKVSDATTSQLASYFDEAVESAKELGSSVDDMISATADWSRMGYNLPDSKTLGEIAVLYKNVGDGISVEEANSSLTSTLQGFQMNASEAINIVDAFNEVSNNYAINSGGIGEALKRSAAAFNAANTDLNQSIALITAGNEIVQSPEKVGTMWQTVSARIRGTKAELEELGESTDDVLSTSKLRDLVKGYTDVDIMLDKDTYKDIYTIVSEIGDKWKELEDVERAALLEALAGKKQSNTLAAVLNNAERLEKIYKTAKDSAGSAQKEQEKYTESIQYSLDQLTAHGEEFWTTFIQTDDVKNVINFFNILIERATKLVDVIGPIPSIIGIAGSAFMGKNGFDLVSYSEKDGWGGLLSSAKVDNKTSNFLNNNLSAGMINTTTDASGLLNAYGLGDNANLAGFVTQLKEGNIQLKEGQSALNAYKKYLKGVEGSSIAATIGTKALGAAMKVLSSIGWMALITAITWGIQKCVEGISNYVNRAEIAREELEEVSNELDSTKNQLTEIDDKISEIKSKGKLGITDQAELEKLESERALIEDQIRLLEIKKELAAEKASSTAVDTALKEDGSNNRKINKKTSNIDGFIEQAKDIQTQIESAEDDTQRSNLMGRYNEIKTDIQENKDVLADIYLDNLTKLENITGDDPLSVEARDKLQAQNDKIAKYIFSAKEYMKMQLEQFESKFATRYNDQWDVIENDTSHTKSTDIIGKDGNNLGIDKTGVTEAGLDGLINKTKELNQSFVDGKITVSEYFDSISKEIENVNLEAAGAKLNGGKGDNSKTDYLEQVITNLTSQVSDAMLYANESFQAGELSVGEYIDSLNSGIDVQKKLVKSTYNLEEGEDGLVKVTKKMDKETRNAAKSFNKLVEEQKNLESLDDFADTFGGLVEKMLEAGYIEGETITDKILGDPVLFSQTVDSLCGEMLRIVNTGGEMANGVSSRIAKVLGVTEKEVSRAMTRGESGLRELVGNNIDAVNEMQRIALDNAKGEINNASQAIGTVLDAIGNAIEKFDYKLEFSPFGAIDFNKDIFEFKDGKWKINFPASFGFNITGSGDSSKSIADSIRGAANFFKKEGSSGVDSITDWGSITDNGDGNSNGEKPPTSNSTDKNKNKTPFDDNYYSTVSAWLKENEKEIEVLERERESLNRQFENALDSGNKEQAEILRNKLVENAKAQKDVLRRQNEAHRITKNDLLASLYDVAPELSGKAWEEISEVDLTTIENRLNNDVELAGDDDYKKNLAKLTLNRFKGIVEDISNIDETIKTNSESWWDNDENLKDNWKSLIDFQDDYSNEWIDNQKAFDKLSEQEELDAYGRMIRNNKEFQRQILDDIALSSEAKAELIKYTNDKIVEYEKKSYDIIKDLRSDLFDELKDQLDDKYDIRISRLESESSLLSKHYDVLNAINEEQHNLNKELLEAETIGAKMNKQERETLFTKKEHTRLSGKLNDIMLDITDLQSDYQRDLATATEDTIEEITNNYERQYELKMKEYEIVRAELNLMKKRQILENTENEKSVRTWNGSGWVYEANLQNVLDAQEELANAEYELKKAKIEEAQQYELNSIDARADALQTEKNRLATAIDDMAKKMEGSGKDITKILKTIAETDLPTFDAIIQSLGDTLQNTFGISGEALQSYRNSATAGGNTGGGSSGLSQEYVSWAKSQMEANSAAWHTADANKKKSLEAANQSLGKILGSDYDEESGTWKHKYATGTKNAHKGLGLFDEDGLGSEFILTKDGVLTQFQGGERVFSPEMTDRLWEIAQQNYNFAPVISQPDFGRLIPIEDKINNAISNISNAFGDTYMIKDVQLNESEGGTLKGFMDFLKKKM